MKPKVSKSGNLERFKKLAMNRNELKKVQGGGWVLIDDVWIWIANK